MNTLRFRSLLALLLALFATTGCAVQTDESGEQVGSLSDTLRAPGKFELFQASNGEWYFNLKSCSARACAARCTRRVRQPRCPSR